MSFRFFLFLFVIAFAACGQSGDEDGTGGPVLVISSGAVFTTGSLTAPSGGAVTLVNNDGVFHSVTSESAADAFDDTGDFDATVAAGGKNVFTLPSAPSGTVYHFYCRFLTSTMSPPNGTITIE